MIKVYSFETCPWCAKVKKYLDSKNIPYEVHDIELNEEDLEACRALTGDTAVPVITADDENYILGFDKERIDKLIEKIA